MKKYITTLTAILLIANLALAQGVDSVIKVSDRTPGNNPCDKGVLPDDIYADFKAAIANFLGSNTLKDIEKQIRDHADDDKAVPIEIHIDDLDGFKEQYVEDTNEFDSPGTEEEAENIYNNHSAYTYLTDTVENGVQVIKIKFFCKNGLRTSLIDNTESGGWKFYELLIHEFVHAKLYAMLALGVAEANLPFQDHDDNDDNDEEEDFFKEVKRLLEKLIKELKDKGLARISPVQQAEEVSIADLGIAEPRLLPTSPLYFLKEIGRGLRQFLTFNPVAKARLELNVANQKAAEVKKMQEIDPANTNAIKEALERYQTSQARLKSRLETLKETSQNPNVDRLLEQLTDLTIKHVKLFDAITRKFEDRADLRKLTQETKEKIEASAAAAAQKDDPAKFATRLEQALIQSKGSDLKHLRSVEIIERIQDKAKGDWRESLEELRREFTAKLGEDIKKKLEKEGEAAVRSGIEQLPGDTARFSIILEEVEAGLRGREKEVVGRVAEVLEKTALEEKDIAQRAEEQIKRAEAAINELESELAKWDPGDYSPAQTFRLEIGGVTQGTFKEISGIESETEVIEYKDDPDLTVRKRPGRTKYSNITLKRGFINDPALWEWYQRVTKGPTERKAVSIIVLDRDGQEVARYNAFEAWPVKWKGPVLDTKGDTYTVEELELAVEKIERARIKKPSQMSVERGEAIDIGALQRVKNLLAQAQSNLAKAKQGFVEGKYGEAFGLARSAEVIARNGLRMLTDVTIKEEDVPTRMEFIPPSNDKDKYVPSAPTYPISPQPTETTKPAERLFCTQEWNPVCGADGKTYSNECMAKSAGVAVKYKGECAAPPTIESGAGTAPSVPQPTTVAPTPTSYEFKLEADDFGFYPDSTITVPKGSRVKIHFIVRATNVYFGGLDFRSSKFKTEPVRSGNATTVEFTADESFTFTSYWPLSGVQKAAGRVVTQ